MKTKRIQLTILAVLLGVTGWVVWQRQAILDWALLYHYTPPTAVTQLASDDEMTAKAIHLLYVNHPVISAGKPFTSHCPPGSEKTVVLGCYIGNDRGIYLYQISDTRLNGVEQVTAAHEMLHAAYRRLSSGQRAKVDAMLQSYYDHGLTDQRIKDTIDAYRKSEPHDVVNEMHSIFGTEVANLPGPLEVYYKQYFTDRTKVAAYTAAYQGEFTSRQTQVAQYDTQLKGLEQQIKANETQLEIDKKSLATQNQQLDSERSSGQIAAYNSGVQSYNRAVDSYNRRLTDTKNLISQYNTIVEQRNNIALEEQQLAQELSASSLPKN